MAKLWESVNSTTFQLITRKDHLKTCWYGFGCFRYSGTSHVFAVLLNQLGSLSPDSMWLHVGTERTRHVSVAITMSVGTFANSLLTQHGNF